MDAYVYYCFSDFSNNPTPRYGGRGCSGSATRSEPCNTNVTCRCKYLDNDEVILLSMISIVNRKGCGNPDLHYALKMLKWSEFMNLRISNVLATAKFHIYEMSALLHALNHMFMWDVLMCDRNFGGAKMGIKAKFRTPN